MPANWSVLQSQLTTYFDNNQVQKTERDTAQTIANAYYNSVLSANILLIPGSTITTPASPSIIANGFENTFRIIKSKKGGMPIAGDYIPAATAITQWWLASTWSPLPPPPGYVAPLPGVRVISGGSPTPLNYNLWNAFNNNIPGKVGAVIATKLVTAFTSHLTLVQGLYIGLIPGPISPILGPPFSWLGVA